MNLTTRMSKSLVKSILEHADAYDWTVQGLGMLRTYIEPELRLHLWNSGLVYDDVSTMHTHPWNFHSLIISGRVRQHRYVKPLDQIGSPPGVVQWQEQKIKCGVGGCLVDTPRLVKLIEMPEEIYRPGDTYHQSAAEIHTSFPDDGTVTLIEREMLDDTEHAYVYFPVDQEWVSAEPRPATDAEISEAVTCAMANWSRGESIV